MFMHTMAAVGVPIGQIVAAGVPIAMGYSGIPIRYIVATAAVGGILGGCGLYAFWDMACQFFYSLPGRTAEAALKVAKVLIKMAKEMLDGLGLNKALSWVEDQLDAAQKTVKTELGKGILFLLATMYVILTYVRRR